MSSNPPRRGGRGGRGRGRGGGGRRQGRGRGGGRRPNDRAPSNHSHSNGNNVDVNVAPSIAMPELKDESVLIAFMPYLKGDSPEATSIHELYQSTGDQRAFLHSARAFLDRHKGQHQQTNGHSLPTGPAHAIPTPSLPTVASIVSPRPSTLPSNPFINTHPPSNHTQGGIPESPGMQEMELKMRDLLSNDNDPVVNIPPPFAHTTTPVNPLSQNGLFQNPVIGAHHHQPIQQPRHIQPPQSQYSFHSSEGGSLSSTPPPNGVLGGTSNGSVGSHFSSTIFPQTNNDPRALAPSPYFQPTPNHSSVPASSTPQQRRLPPQDVWKNSNGSAPMSIVAGASTPTPGAVTPNSVSPLITPMRPASSPVPFNATAKPPPKTPSKREYQPKRLWTHLEDQPGKVFANNVAAGQGNVLNLRPRQELTAQWMLPLSFMREKAGSDDPGAIRRVLRNLAVGLFRRGCTENGSQASIVSKEIVNPGGGSRNDYPYQFVNNAIVGSVPFYSPRTPGHVVFRMYWKNDPLHTLATGPTLNVRVTEDDFESAIRFILSNFKAKKVNPTSLSSLNSLALVLEQFQLRPNGNPNSVPSKLEGAGRPVWGCICEARKVLEACASEYSRTTTKLQKLEEAVEELKSQVDEEKDREDAVTTSSYDTGSMGRESMNEPSELVLTYREKLKSLMSGRASCERKWRDSQLAFASILKAAVGNPSISVLLRRDLISKLRVEYELWCPLSEEFAVPGDDEDKMWFEPLARLPHNLNADHYRMTADARSKMQLRTLGFDPNISPLENILYPVQGQGRQMHREAVNVFNQLSTAMGQLYQERFATADRIIKQREIIRMETEKCVLMSNALPPGTAVAVFGSSANGFGSPKSDLDMCLQIPQAALFTNADDAMEAMAKVANTLATHGMKDVDVSRLTARIPVIKFNCPKPLQGENADEEPFMECDLSMHNPLAVLNTSLLRTYAEINPIPRVLAGVIKRWAKARDINNPARHTLSSYGYILMLLHFLTFHKRSGNGLVVPLNKSERNQAEQQRPLMPNLLWMDPQWPQMPAGSAYREQVELPRKMMKHPMDDKAVVNTYFYHPQPHMLEQLQRLFPGQDLSLGILLASFFRYYAYEFDYKRHVVSLHSTFKTGQVEREVKAELDGWRNYSAALTIEDPFETFYDVAHVLRGGYYHRIRREFAVAYSKIADAALGKNTGSWGTDINPADMTGSQLIDWICEPVVNEKEDASSKE